MCHKNAILEKGKTIAVLGSGFKHIYPEENISLVKEIIKNDGAIISEYPPNTEVNLSNFPIRNRIIAGISECTIVVEAKARSGSSVTARHSSMQGKTVYCVPGRIGDKTGRGTNNLIKKGAHILTDINEILNELGEEIEVKEKIEAQEIRKDDIGNKLTKNTQEGYQTLLKESKKVKKEYIEIYNLLIKSPMNINEIARTLKINMAEVNMKLTIMEIEGLIDVLPGNMIKIKES